MNPLNKFINSLSTKLPAYTPSNSFTNTNKTKVTSGPMVSNPVKPFISPSSSNLSATNIVKPVVQPSTTPKTDPKSQFIDTLQTPQNAYDAVTGARTEYGASLGLPDMIGGKPVSSPKGNVTGTTTAPTVKEDPYQKYLQSLFDPKQAEIARGNITALNERTSAELLRTREREDELRKNKIGQLERGQSYQLGEEQRLSNRSLADLAIAKGASVDTLNQIMSAGKEAYGMTQPIEVGGVLYQKGADGNYTPLTGTGADAEQFTLGKDQIRYDAQGNVIASGVSGGAGSTEAPIIKTFGQTDYAWNPQTSQWDPVQLSDISPQVKIDKAEKLLTDIFDLRDTKGLSGAVGMKGISSLLGLKGTPIAGTPAANYLAKVNQIKGQLTLENMGVMKGVLSDADIKIITDASTALTTNMSETEFLKELGKIEGILKKVIASGGAMSSGGTTGDGGLFDW